MCIKSAPYLHKKSANWAKNIVVFYAVINSNSTYRRCRSGILILIIMLYTVASNIMQIIPK